MSNWGCFGEHGHDGPGEIRAWCWTPLRTTQTRGARWRFGICRGRRTTAINHIYVDTYQEQEPAATLEDATGTLLETFETIRASERAGDLLVVG